MNKESRLFFQMVRDFLTVYLPKQKASSPNTIESYRTAMNKYLDYSCNELKIGLDSYTFQHSSRELLENILKEWKQKAIGRCRAGTNVLPPYAGFTDMQLNAILPLCPAIRKWH